MTRREKEDGKRLEIYITQQVRGFISTIPSPSWSSKRNVGVRHVLNSNGLNREMLTTLRRQNVVAHRSARHEAKEIM